MHEISPNLAKIHISPHLLCEKTEISLHVEKFHEFKSEISPHGRFLLHLHVGDRGDKYEVWITLNSLHLNINWEKQTLEQQLGKTKSTGEKLNFYINNRVSQKNFFLI